MRAGCYRKEVTRVKRDTGWLIGLHHLRVEKAEGAERQSEEAGEAMSDWKKLIVVN
jgi:hypothetical protein